MSENSKIEWCDHTFNPWRGCTKVSPGCAHCYAETLSHRNPAVLGEWGKGKPRVKASPAMWRQPLKWNKEAHDLRFRIFTRPRVFCASLADWLDDEVPIEWLADLLTLIHATPNLDWLMLTKRPQNWEHRILKAAAYASTEAKGALLMWIGRGVEIPNVWIGTSVEDQARAEERIPRLLEIPARIRFLSCEPLLGPVDLVMPGTPHNPLHFNIVNPEPLIHWVIAGGESGPDARPMHPDWARNLRDQCAAAGVPFLFKQWGEYLPICETPADWSPTPDGLDWHVGKTSLVLQRNGEHRNDFPKGAMTCIRLGKKAAGRTLDGKIHHEFPT